MANILDRVLALPKRRRGRPSRQAEQQYQVLLARWCEGILKLRSRLDFTPSSRGWCYVLEEHGLEKGDFDVAEKVINDCRKAGLLPLDICSEDEGRSADNLESIDEQSPEDFAAGWIDYLANDIPQSYTPISFWNNLPVYLQTTVEKVDLKSLFNPVCHEFHIPIYNISGWNDINSRAAIMRRFAHWEARGKQCVLLHCGDHDPGGLQISDYLRQNFGQLTSSVGWDPVNLIVDRFGLNADFIDKERLTWIDNLITGSGGRLDDPDHPDHFKPYVQNYLKRFGARKVEANALVVRPEAGRKLCRQVILRYIPETAIQKYMQKLKRHRTQARREIARLLERWSQ